MKGYVRYACTVCRRQKDLPHDPQRAFLRHCVITKGCPGQLLEVDRVAAPRPTPPEPTLLDWTPRGSAPAAEPAPEAPAPVPISTSSTGAITLALFLTLAEFNALAGEVTVTIEARKVEDIALRQYTFHVTAPTATIAGPDDAGLTLRFDAAAIAEGRVLVRVNGVGKFDGVDLTLAPDTITFLAPLAPGDVVGVTVYQALTIVERQLTLLAHAEGSDPNAWANVRYCEDGAYAPAIDARRRWFLFSTSGTALLGVAGDNRLRLKQVTGLTVADLATRARFLLAQPPYEGKDRVLTLAVNGGRLQQGFLLRVGRTPTGVQLEADAPAVEDVFPPLQLLVAKQPPTSALPWGSYVNPAAELVGGTATSAVLSDGAATALRGKVVLGPA